MKKKVCFSTKGFHPHLIQASLCLEIWQNRFAKITHHSTRVGDISLFCLTDVSLSRLPFFFSNCLLLRLSTWPFLFFFFFISLCWNRQNADPKRPICSSLGAAVPVGRLGRHFKDRGVIRRAKGEDLPIYLIVLSNTHPNTWFR